MKREDVVAETESWVGTPFHHEGRQKGVGVDCAGLIIGIAKNLGLADWDFLGYSRQPHPATTLGLLNELESKNIIRRIPIQDAKPGDFYLFRILEDPQHFGIIVSEDRIVHAMWKKNKSVSKCVKTRFHKYWSERIVAAYRFSGVDE